MSFIFSRENNVNMKQGARCERVGYNSTPPTQQIMEVYTASRVLMKVNVDDWNGFQPNIISQKPLSTFFRDGLERFDCSIYEKLATWPETKSCCQMSLLHL